ncbi:MAG TPA: DoxX family protein [Candidatus Eisenbacteria bacterium]|nr:DoxX family protein [Candidatus Eisenbacteria bacterium]
MKPSRRSVWAARAMWGIAVSFLTFDAIGKLLQVPAVIEGSARLGYPEHSVLAIGVIELVCVALYVIPRTAVLGALMLTGYLGGAVATHFRIEDPLFTHLLFPIYVAVLLWGALVLSDGRVRRLVLGPRTMLPAPDVRLTEEVQS